MSKHFAVRLVLCALVAGILLTCTVCRKRGDADLISELVIDSKRGLSLMESDVLQRIELDTRTVRAAQAYIRLHADYTSYHLLFALRRKAREAYDQIPDSTRAAVLCSSLEHLIFLNDWGYLDPTESYDGEAAIALVELGKSALGCLQGVLDNCDSAPLFGSESAAISHLYQYRRADFAYRYVCSILGIDMSFDSDPRERDKHINALKQNIGRIDP